MNRVIITGASGLLGQFLCQYFAKKYEVIGCYNTSKPNIQNVDLVQIDLTEPSTLRSLVQKEKPQFLIHTAGYTSVDDCEMNPQIAHLQNVTCTKNICDILSNFDTKLIHISTDHLFSGKYENSSEESEVEPLNVYAQTKLLAEKEAFRLNNSVIVRTNFYGGHTEKKMSFTSWIINELKQNKQINMFDDVFFTSISICGLAENLELLMNSQLNGIYNIVGNERLSKYAFALKLAQIFELPTELIFKTSVENLHLKAKRPRDMSLSTEKVKKDLVGFRSENVYEGLEKIKAMSLF